MCSIYLLVQMIHAMQIFLILYCETKISLTINYYNYYVGNYNNLLSYFNLTTS